MNQPRLDKAQPVSSYVRPRTLAEGLAQRSDNFLLLRLLAAAMVIYGHSYELTAFIGQREIFAWLHWPAHSGTIAVDAFFLISGFMISASYMRRKNVLDYVWARALRIVPAYAICVFGCAFLIGAAVTDLPLRDYIADPATLDYALVNMHFGVNLRWELPGVFVDNARLPTVNGALWTLPVEVRMYVWAGLLGVSGILARRRYAAILIASLIVAGVLNSTSIPLVPIEMYLRPAGMFALGTLCYLYRDRIPVSPVLFLLLAASCWALWSTPLYPIAFALALASFVFCFAYLLPWFGYNRFGDYSYGLYLWGFPVQQTVIHLWPSITPMQNVAISLPVALGLGILSWHLVEKPALKLKRLPEALRGRLPGGWAPWVVRARTRITALSNASLWTRKP